MPLKVAADTPARAALETALEQPGRSQQWLAELLDMKQPSISRWVSGESRPPDHVRECLALLLGIPTDDWRTDKERALVRHCEKITKVGPVPMRTAKKRKGTRRAKAA